MCQDDSQIGLKDEYELCNFTFVFTGNFFSKAMILQSGYSSFLPTFQTVSKKRWIETFFFSFDHFNKKVSTNTKSF